MTEGGAATATGREAPVGRASGVAFTGLIPRGKAPIQRPGALAVSTIFKLIIEDDEGKTTVYPLVDGEVSIGRKEGNTIRLMERNVSRRHARLVRDADAVLVEDLDSYNGVRINGERIDGRHPVREGDLIEIGDYHLAVRRADDDSEDTLSLEDTQTLEAHPEEDAPEPMVEAGWPAGTVPDFQLPRDLLSTARLPRETSAPTAVGFSPASDLSLDDGGEEPTQVPPLASDQPTSLPPFPAPTPLPASLPPAPAATVREESEQESTKHLRRGPAAVDDVPRLICVSTQHAGKVFRLDRSEMVIGREEGNNHIVVDHRSVSRNHAKIQFDGRVHKIVDLHSANGILVNGDDYTMTNLRAGDLIELGLVRFRFVPAGLRFEPDDDEAREMRKNGIEPPGASDRARTLPAHDPSAAATVTDAPRPVTVPTPTVTRTAPVNGTYKDTVPDNTAAWRSGMTEGDPFERAPTATAASPHRLDEHSPTALVAAAAPLGGGETTRTQRRAGGLDYRSTMIALIVMLTALVAVLLVLLSMRGDPRHDRRLDELYNQRDYEGAVRYHESHQGEFADSEKALETAIKAKVRLEDTSTGRASPVASPEPSPEPEPAPSEPEPPAPAAKRPSKPDARVSRLASQGEAALLSGDLRRAERVLRECLRRNAGFAPCHRHMAVVQANLKRNRRAVRHYRRYLELAPDAPDAGKVREILEAFEQEGGR